MTFGTILIYLDTPRRGMKCSWSRWFGSFGSSTNFSAWSCSSTSWSLLFRTTTTRYLHSRTTTSTNTRVNSTGNAWLSTTTTADCRLLICLRFARIQKEMELLTWMRNLRLGDTFRNSLKWCKITINKLTTSSRGRWKIIFSSPKSKSKRS